MRNESSFGFSALDLASEKPNILERAVVLFTIWVQRANKSNLCVYPNYFSNSKYTNLPLPKSFNILPKSQIPNPGKSHYFTTFAFQFKKTKNARRHLRKNNDGKRRNPYKTYAR